MRSRRIARVVAVFDEIGRAATIPATHHTEHRSTIQNRTETR